MTPEGVPPAACICQQSLNTNVVLFRFFEVFGTTSSNGTTFEFANYPRRRIRFPQIFVMIHYESEIESALVAVLAQAAAPMPSPLQWRRARAIHSLFKDIENVDSSVHQLVFAFCD